MSDLREHYPHLLFQRNWSLTEDVMYVLGECLAYIRVLRDVPLLPAEHQRLLTVSLRRGALATTAIEGNTLSEAELDAILDVNQELPESRQYQRIEVENVIAAMNRIKDQAIGGPDQLISTDLILEMHRSVTANLGAHVDCIPGRLRNDNRHVGTYRAPDYMHVPQLMERFTEWLRVEFRYPNYPHEHTPILQAIVAHIYLEWIHPFADGNGRTGRLLEFYILVRGKVPVVASTILSNHYNETRSEYYRHFDNARKKRDLTEFLLYAIRGLRDGLRASLGIAQHSVLKITWQHLVYSEFRKQRGSKSVLDRRRDLVLSMIPGRSYTKDELLFLTPKLSKAYANRERLGSRDLNELIEMGLLIFTEGRYRLNTDSLLDSRFPETKT
jgi:Fic family protein